MSDMYYEVAITAEAVVDKLRVKIEHIAAANGFGLFKSDEEGMLTSTITTSLGSAIQHCTALVRKLHENGFEVKRYKIGVTLSDSREYDDLKLLE